ncbi:MAG TPA: hypothetical protein VK837_10460 [Longimicrobiales bacterium]|nr:hypothetical protein [Longimicrobiales bacterium]
MTAPPLLGRIKSSRLFQVLILYLGASWVVIEVAGVLQDALYLPDWLTPVALVLLLVGLVIVLATAWIQGNPQTDVREASGEVPETWELDFGEMVGQLRRGKLPHLTWPRVLVGGVFALSLLFGVAGAFVLLRERGGGGPAPLAAEEAGVGLAIVPFAVSGLDEDVYGEGVISLLATTLDGVAGQRAIDIQTVLARYGEVLGEEAPDLARVLEVGRRAGAKHVLTGSVVGTGGTVRMVGDLYDAETGSKLGTARADAPADSLIVLVDRFSIDAARVLLTQGEEGGSVQHLAALTTSSLDALLAYLEGESAHRRVESAAALGAYERAIEHDSTFALAHLRAADLSGWAGVAGTTTAQAIAHLRAAERFRDRLPAREQALLAAHLGVRTNDATQLPAAEVAVRRYPDDPDLWEALSELHWHLGQRALRPVAERLEPLERAVELAPNFAPHWNHLVDYHLSFGDSATAAEVLERESALFPDSGSGPWFHQEEFDFLYGDSTARARAVDRFEERGGVSSDASFLGLRRLAARTELLARLAEGDPDGRFASQHAFLLLKRGRIREALEGHPASEPLGAYLRLELVERAVYPADSLGQLTLPAVIARLRAARILGDSAMYAALIEEMRAESAEALQSNPSLADLPDGPVGSVPIAEAFWGAFSTPSERAVQRMLEVFPHVPDDPVSTAWWLDKIASVYDEIGDRRKAFRYYSAAAAQADPYAALEAARLADALSMPDEARRLYREVLIAWEGADPEFEPWLEEARGWLERLPG